MGLESHKIQYISHARTHSLSPRMGLESHKYQVFHQLMPELTHFPPPKVRKRGSNHTSIRTPTTHARTHSFSMKAGLESHKIVIEICQNSLTLNENGARITQLYHYYSKLNTSTKITIRQCATSSQLCNLANTPTKHDEATKTTHPILLI